MKKLAIIIIIGLSAIIATAQSPTMDNITVKKRTTSSNFLALYYGTNAQFVGNQEDLQKFWGFSADSETSNLVHFSQCSNVYPYAMNLVTNMMTLKIHGILDATTLAVGGVDITTTPTKLNYLTSATGTTGTVSTNMVFSTSPTFATSVIGGSSFDVFNTSSTTINAFGAATTMNIGGTPTTTVTHNYSTNATANATTKTINLATGGVSGSTTVLNMGSASGTTYSAIGGAYSSSYTLKVYGTIYATGAITSNSDIRTKTVFGKIDNVIDSINKVDVIQFVFNKDKKSILHYGYSAQNLNSIFPVVARHNKDDTYELDHLGISAINTKAIQELSKENDELKKRVENLERRMLKIEMLIQKYHLK